MPQIEEIDDHDTDLVEDDAEPEVVAREYAPGELAPSIVTKSKVWKPDELRDEDMLDVITGLLRSCFESDEPCRRWQVLETWELRMSDRGYQHLESTSEGGWRVPGSEDEHANALANMNDAGVFSTPVLPSQGDIAIGCLNRGAIKVNFTPRRSKRPQDVAAAAAANEYKWLWQKANADLQYDLTSLGWTDPRVITWTRTVADKRFGLDDEGSPMQAELTTPWGVLESRAPMLAGSLKECGFLSLFESLDHGLARAAYPWMNKKLKPCLSTFGNTDFEAIARINTRVGVASHLTAGISGLRETGMGYHWIRPGLYFSDSVNDLQREYLLQNFEDGMFVVTGGQEVCAVWEESMDDHLEMGMFVRGQGQNRRALGSGDLPIQKRINLWMDLLDRIFRSSSPITLLESQAFNAEAVASLENTPNRFLSVALDVPGGQTMESVVGQTPVAAAPTGLMETAQFFMGALIQQIDGATPALFGGGEGVDNTVGATQIRLNQALERYGTPWQMANKVIARACWQAAKCCGDNREGEIQDSAEGYGDVIVNPDKLRGGEFNCIPETLGAIPESGAQREAKVLAILDMANSNEQVASIVATPSNAREIVAALHIEDVITVSEADSEDKQLEEIEILLNSAPLINPAYEELSQHVEKLNAVHEAAKAVAAQGVQNGEIPGPELIEQGQQMEQSLTALQQQLASTPQYLPSVPVAQDESEDHATEAATLFAWMQKPDGRAIRRKAAKETSGGDLETSPNWCKWTNCYTHWAAHKAMAAKFTPAQAAPPKVSLTGKLSPAQQAQLLQTSSGVQTDPASLNAPAEVETEQRAYTMAGEQVVKTKQRPN